MSAAGLFGPQDMPGLWTHRQPIGLTSTPKPHQRAPVQVAFVVAPSASRISVVKANSGGGSTAEVQGPRPGKRST